MPLSVPGLPDLPPELSGPVAVELAKPVRAIPAANALSGGCLYEPKWDGYRLVVVRGAGSTRVWSKQGRDLSDRFPDIVAAARAQHRSSRRHPIEPGRVRCAVVSRGRAPAG